MSVDITCDECKNDIENGDDAYCYDCIIDLREALEKAKERISELEDRE